MVSAVRLIRSSLLSDVAQYAYAATADKAARLIFLAGACPLEDDGSTAAVGDYAGQAARCIETLTLALDAAGATIEDVISTRVLVASSRQADLVAAWGVVRDAFHAATRSACRDDATSTRVLITSWIVAPAASSARLSVSMHRAA